MRKGNLMAKCSMCYGKKVIYVGSIEINKYAYEIEPCPECTAPDEQNSGLNWDLNPGAGN